LHFSHFDKTQRYARKPMQYRMMTGQIDIFDYSFRNALTAIIYTLIRMHIRSTLSICMESRRKF
jgi:hypothetical protein